MSSEENISRIIKNAIAAQLLDLHVALPARVETYDPAKQKADIKPLLKKRYKTAGKATELPVIPAVPVIWPSGSAGKAFLHLPLKPGDLGMAIFCERSIDSWLAGDGKSVDAKDPRHHDLSDAVFIPGVLPFQKALQNVSADNVLLQNDQMKIELLPSGKIRISGASQDLVSVLSAALGHISAAIGHTAGAMVIIPSGSSAGTYPLDPGTVAGLNSDKSALEADKSNLETLKA